LDLQFKGPFFGPLTRSPKRGPPSPTRQPQMRHATNNYYRHDSEYTLHPCSSFYASTDHPAK